MTKVDLHRLAVRPRAQGLVDPHGWPEEPSSPTEIDPVPFTHALVEVCPKERTSDSVRPIAQAVLREAERFDVDPFLLAAVAQQQGGCRDDHVDSWGRGATRIHPEMYRKSFDGRVYRYPVPDGRGGFGRGRLELPRARFGGGALLELDDNVYFAAAFMKTWEEQCPAIDAVYGSAPHRHAISHFVYGDRVRGTGPEAAIFAVRRRLLEAYRGRRLPATGLWSPLGGAPRLAISGPGELRQGGARLHRGIDFASQRGEPVYAMADGIVVAAGADRGPGPLRPVPPVNASRLRRLGPRGLAVEVRHDDGLLSVYAHLESFKVAAGQRVRAGTLLGYVGRSGMEWSSAHLHLGLFRGGTPLDPLDHLGDQVLSPGLSRHWWDTVYPELARNGLAARYPRPPGVEPIRVRHDLRHQDRRRRRHRWQRRAAAAGRRGHHRRTDRRRRRRRGGRG